MSLSAHLVAQDSSWRQRSELAALADLPPQLDSELERLDKEFWVSAEKLKEVVNRFREELDEGTFVCGCVWVFCVAWGGLEIGGFV